MTIARQPGTIIGGLVAGGGGKGLSMELDELIAEAARRIEEAYRRDVEIRFNSNRRSGGAFLTGLGSSCGITANLHSISDLRETAEASDHDPDALLLARKLDPDGPDQQISVHIFIGSAVLKDPKTANNLQEDERRRYAWLPAWDLDEAIEILAAAAEVPAAR